MVVGPQAVDQCLEVVSGDGRLGHDEDAGAGAEVDQARHLAQQAATDVHLVRGAGQFDADRGRVAHIVTSCSDGVRTSPAWRAHVRTASATSSGGPDALIVTSATSW